jgi:hypothetical protein
MCERVRARVGARGHVALLMQHATRMRHTVICGVWFQNIIPHYLINGTAFGKKLLNVKCVLIFSTTFI